MIIVQYTDVIILVNVKVIFSHALFISFYITTDCSHMFEFLLSLFLFNLQVRKLNAYQLKFQSVLALPLLTENLNCIHDRHFFIFCNIFIRKYNIMTWYLSYNSYASQIQYTSTISYFSIQITFILATQVG